MREKMKIKMVIATIESVNWDTTRSDFIGVIFGAEAIVN